MHFGGIGLHRVLRFLNFGLDFNVHFLMKHQIGVNAMLICRELSHLKRKSKVLSIPMTLNCSTNQPTLE